MNEENFLQKYFVHYTDIVIFVLGHFMVTQPVHIPIDFASIKFLK